MKTFIEIGAADFDTMINADNWRGIICEPHPVFYRAFEEKMPESKHYYLGDGSQ